MRPVKLWGRIYYRNTYSDGVKDDFMRPKNRMKKISSAIRSVEFDCSSHDWWSYNLTPDVVFVIIHRQIAYGEYVLIVWLYMNILAKHSNGKLREGKKLIVIFEWASHKKEN